MTDPTDSEIEDVLGTVLTYQETPSLPYTSGLQVCD